MPIGGSNIGWSNSDPPDTESAGLGDDRIRSMKSSVQEALDNEHNFASGGGANTGYHRFGSARAYYGAQSLVSSSGSDARLMLTSDTSRLFHVGSAGTSFIGGATVLSVGSFPGGVPQRHYWAVEFGDSATGAGGAISISFPNSGFSGVPWIAISARTNVATIMTIDAKTATSFQALSWLTDGSAAPIRSFDWFSVGTRVL